MLFEKGLLSALFVLTCVFQRLCWALSDYSVVGGIKWRSVAWGIYDVYQVDCVASSLSVCVYG